MRGKSRVTQTAQTNAVIDPKIAAVGVDRRRRAILQRVVRIGSSDGVRPVQTDLIPKWRTTNSEANPAAEAEAAGGDDSFEARSSDQMIQSQRLKQINPPRHHHRQQRLKNQRKIGSGGADAQSDSLSPLHQQTRLTAQRPMQQRLTNRNPPPHIRIQTRAIPVTLLFCWRFVFVATCHIATINS